MTDERKITKAGTKTAGGLFRFYNFKLAVRVTVFVAAIVIYLINKDLLDFTGEWQWMRSLPMCCIWLILMTEIVMQLNPCSKVSKGCLKQFPSHYVAPANGYDKEELKRRVKFPSRELLITQIWVKKPPRKMCLALWSMHRRCRKARGFPWFAPPLMKSYIMSLRVKSIIFSPLSCKEN